MRAQQKITREIQILGNLVRGIYSPETLGDYPGKNTQALLERIKGLWNTMVRTLEPRFLNEEVQTVFGYIYLTCLEALPPEPLYQNLAESILQELRTNYPRFNPLDVKNQNRLLQWEGQTKRKVQKIFFLPLDKKPGKSATLEFLFGFSAMLAMVFSIGFGYAITTLFSEESFGLAAGLIVAYALKDRIKDFFKNISPRYRRQIPPGPQASGKRRKNPSQTWTDGRQLRFPPVQRPREPRTLSADRSLGARSPQFTSPALGAVLQT
jgi:hypothetical protein